MLLGGGRKPIRNGTLANGVATVRNNLADGIKGGFKLGNGVHVDSHYQGQASE